MTEDIKYEERPWGNFTQFAFNEECTVKILEVKSGEELSLQSHKKRDELWVVLDEGLKVELDDKVIFPKEGEKVVIKRGMKHRLSSPNGGGRILEVSFGCFDENDEIRYADKYGRN